jgi:hypothetical protein
MKCRKKVEKEIKKIILIMPADIDYSFFVSFREQI